MNWVWMIAGIASVVAGAELLVRGAVVLATALRVSSLVVGLTVVAYGTSAPEMAVSVISSVRGEPQIALGNVVGSNIFNVLFVLGASALIVPLAVSRQLIRFDVPLMIVVSIATYGMALDGKISRVEGLFLVAGIVAYTIALAWIGRRDANTALRSADSRDLVPRHSWLELIGNVFLMIGGLGLLVLGASWLVEASSALARSFGVSDLVIGVTIVAVGTSLPEVATSLVAAFKGERDLAVGNVVGSNVFNLLGVLGASAAVSREGMPVIDDALRFDIPVIVLVALVCWPVVRTQT
jgi:cation:H+ antiporter